MKASRTKPRAFTLVELLAATVLSALLMITLLMVIGSFGRDRQAMAKRSASQPPQALLSLLRWDLLNARTVQRVGHSMCLAGFDSLDAQTLAPLELRPVEVEYAVQQIGDRSWLIRRQSEPGAAQAISAELVCPGVRDIAAIPLNLKSGHLSAVSTSALTAAPLPISSQVQIRISFDGDKPPIDELAVLQ